MRVLMLTIVMALLFVALLAAPAFAAGPPNVECPEPPTVPGFTKSGFTDVGSQHYAGARLNPNQGKAQPASQYDIACFGGHRG